MKEIDVPSLVKDLRARLRLTQEQFAKEVGVTVLVDQILARKKREANVDVADLEALADELVSQLYFAGRDGGGA